MPLGAGKSSSPYSTTGFFSVPIPSITHSTTSPGLRNLGGSKPIPTPAGVPVAMMVPAFRVMPAAQLTDHFCDPVNELFRVGILAQLSVDTGLES